MNFALTDEQEFLQEAARGTLSRVKTLEVARKALEGEPLPDLWPAACEAGWPGLLIGEEHAGAGLGVMDAMLVFAELGRVLASVPLLGHLPATLLVSDSSLLAALASGEMRAVYVPTRPAGDVETRWTVDALHGSQREEAGAGAAWVPDAPGADVVVAVTADGAVIATEDFEVEPVTRYDSTRPLGHVRFTGGSEQTGDAATAWYVAQALIGAESLGAVERALELSVAYAKERFTFGRAIGSYQAVKHQLVEVLRRMDNARSLMYYTGWAGADMPSELPLAASAFRLSAGKALDDAARTQISVHGGIGATWEHDAPLYFRRAQLSRRLLGGTAGAADRVAGELFDQARAAAA